MGLSTALFNSVSGLNTTSTAISVIGDNIANVNTTGFKERRAEFSDVLGQSINSVGGFSDLGAGAKLSRVSTIFGQGTFENTGRSTDLAIQGRGFFVLDGDDGRFFSRAGIFTIDNTGTLVNPSNLRVQGFSIDPLTGQSSGQLGDINLSNALAPPQPTSSVDISMNLGSSEPVLAGFDAANPIATSTFNTGMTFYDSLGVPHFASAYFTKTSATDWEWNVALQPSDTTIAPGPGEQVVVQGGGTLAFNSNGELVSTTGNSVTFEFAGGATPSQVVDFDFGPVAGGTGRIETTSFDGASGVNSANQDGFSAGSLQSIAIDAEGFLTGQFSNGESIALAQVALAGFPNVEGLSSVGSGNMIESRASGQPLIGEAGGPGFGEIRAGNLEQSTVDLAAQFVKLIINQRAFQANTRTVSVTNELLANLVSLGQ